MFCDFQWEIGVCRNHRQAFTFKDKDHWKTALYCERKALWNCYLGFKKKYLDFCQSRDFSTTTFISTTIPYISECKNNIYVCSRESINTNFRFVAQKTAFFKHKTEKIHVGLVIVFSAPSVLLIESAGNVTLLKLDSTIELDLSIFNKETFLNLKIVVFC